jgi:hypothetical protein
MSIRPSKPRRDEPLAAAINWSALAAFLGCRVEDVRALALVPEGPAGEHDEPEKSERR